MSKKKGARKKQGAKTDKPTNPANGSSRMSGTSKPPPLRNGSSKTSKKKSEGSSRFVAGGASDSGTQVARLGRSIAEGASKVRAGGALCATKVLEYYGFGDSSRPKSQAPKAKADAERHRNARSRAWLVYLVVGVFGACMFFSLSGVAQSPVYDFLYDFLGVSAVVALLAGVRMQRPEYPLPWYLFAAGIATLVAGDFTLNFYENVLGIEAPFPSLADAFWLGAYPILAYGLVLLIRSRAPGRDWAGLIDAMIIATGMAILSWVFLMHRYADDETLGLLEKVISMAYPLADVVLLAVMARLAVAPGARTPAYRLLGLSLVAVLIGDTLYSHMLLEDTYYTGSPPDFFFLLCYVLWGAAALHPTMGTLSEPGPEREMKLTWGRLSLLAAAAFTVPMVRVIQEFRGEPMEVPVSVGGYVILSMLVLMRMVGLVRKHERAVARERTLRKAGAALVASPSREGIYDAALDATLELVGDAKVTRASIAMGSAEKMVVAKAIGDRAAEAQDAQLEPRELPEPIRSGLLGQHAVVAENVTPSKLRKALGFKPKAQAILASPLLVEGRSKGALLIDSDLPLHDELKGGLETLGPQVALALEGAALAEDLRQSEERFRSLVQNSSDLILILGPDGDLRYVSPSVQWILGRLPEEMLESSIFDWVHLDDTDRMRGALSQCLEVPEVNPTLELRFSHADDSWRRAELIGNNLLGEPTVDGIVFNVRDVTERERANARLQEAEAKYRTLVERIPAVIYISTLGEVGSMIYVSPRIEDMLGYSQDEWGADFWTTRIHPEDKERVLAEERAHTGETGNESYSMEYRLLARDGRVVWVRNEAEVVKDGAGRARFWQGILVDISERKVLEEQLTHQAFHDPLTGLPNRALFMDRLEHALARATRNGGQVAVLFLDLDDFKVINDSLGHKAGDQLLMSVSERLLACARSGDTVARLGGDEFTLLLEDIDQPQEVVHAVDRLTKKLLAPFYLEGHEVYITASVGISQGGAEAGWPENFLRNADVAMYEAKSKGKACYEVFDADMDTRALERLKLESEMRRALTEEEFRLHYQPLVDLSTGRISGVEALVRWEHPERGLIPPGKFIPLAEKTGLIIPLGQWVLENACEQLRRWQEQDKNNSSLVLSVNLSPKQFQHPELVEDISRALARSGLGPRSLKLEITENVVMEDAEANTAKLHELKTLGIQLAIDDFGTGYSSLSYLKRFPVDVLKIDRSFVEGLGHASEDTAVVRATVALAKSMGLSVTAEGIETAEQLASVSELGCDVGQGFFIACPAPGDAVGELLTKRAIAYQEGNQTGGKSRNFHIREAS